MNSLRAHIAWTLVGSIICVVGLSTLVIFSVMREIKQLNFGEGLVERVRMITPALEFGRTGSRSCTSHPSPGPAKCLRNRQPG